MIDVDHYSEVEPSEWVWPNFKPVELASRGDGSLILSRQAIDRLQWVRSRADRPMKINSAYRDPIYNALIGGAPLSRHKFGDAFDVAIGVYDRHALLQLMRAGGFTGFGFYQTFLHVDCGKKRQWYGGNVARQLWNF